MIAKYRKKPVVIEAIKLTNVSFDAVLDFIGADNNNVFIGENSDRAKGIEIETLEGIMFARLGDFIIKGVSGEVYPCKPEIFEKTYELVTADNSV